MLKLNCVMLGSDNPESLADFYGEVLQTKPAMQDDNMTGYMVGGCFLGIGRHDKVKGKSQNPERIIYFFETPDLEKEFDRIKAIEGASVIQGPYDPSGGDTKGLATLADPDGNYFQLASPWES